MNGRDTSEPRGVGKADLEGHPSNRRVFLLMSLGVLVTGCSTESSQRMVGLPGPLWPDRPGAPETTVPDETVAHDPPNPMTRLSEGVLPRNAWSRGKAIPALMNRMIPIRYITVHHDGMEPFYGDSRRDAAERLELIRRSHRNRNWGDIGYHFIVDRGGRVWEGRPLKYQGAHVKDHNEGNIGVMCMGNFELQTPTRSQLQGLNLHLTRLMRMFRVSVRNVRTHQEWAKTACPGRSLQRHMETVRRNNTLG